MIDENWYIVGGGDNASGNMHMFPVISLFFVQLLIYSGI